MTAIITGGSVSCSQNSLFELKKGGMKKGGGMVGYMVVHQLL